MKIITFFQLTPFVTNIEILDMCVVYISSPHCHDKFPLFASLDIISVTNG